MPLPPFALMEKEGAVRPSCPLLCKGALRTPESVTFTKITGGKSTWFSGCHGYLGGAGTKWAPQALDSFWFPPCSLTPNPHHILPPTQTKSHPLSNYPLPPSLSPSLPAACSYIVFSFATSTAKRPKCPQAGGSPIPELPLSALLPQVLQPGLGTAARCHRDPSWFSSIPEVQGVRQRLPSGVPYLYPEPWAGGAAWGSAGARCRLGRCSAQTQSEPCSVLALAVCFYILSSTRLPPVLSWLFLVRLLYSWGALGFTDL